LLVPPSPSQREARVLVVNNRGILDAFIIAEDDDHHEGCSLEGRSRSCPPRLLHLLCVGGGADDSSRRRHSLQDNHSGISSAAALAPTNGDSCYSSAQEPISRQMRRGKMGPRLSAHTM
jgi:hypothetical protein